MILLGLLLALASCNQQSKTGPGAARGASVAQTSGGALRIWADPALKGALDALAPKFKALHPTGWTVEYKESVMLDQGMAGSDRPDVILCAAAESKKLRVNAAFDASTERTFAGDLLALVTRKARIIPVGRVGDLPQVQFKALGVGGPNTSLGYYSEQALVTDGAAKKVQKLTRGYGSQARLLAAVRSGEVDLGFVYASTVAQNPDLRVSTTVPEDLYEDIRYVALATKAGDSNPGTSQLLTFLAEDKDAQQTLGAYGYVDRATAMIENR